MYYVEYIVCRYNGESLSFHVFLGGNPKPHWLFPIEIIDGFIEGLVTRHEFENQRCVDPSKRGLSKEGLYYMFVLETKSQIFLPFDFHHQNLQRILGKHKE